MLKTTCGTVTVCVTVEPDVIVLVNVITVDGMSPVNGGGVGLGPLLPPVGAASPDVAGADVAGAEGAGAEGEGTRVMVDGTPVQIPGFSGTNSAQMPTR